MSHFAGRVEHFYRNFWQMVRPYHPLVASIAAKASHARDLPEALEVVVGSVTGTFEYRSDMELWGQEDYWASAEEVSLRRAGDCDDLALFGSSVLFAMGVPHYLTIGHLRGRLAGLEALPHEAPGHVWLEVDDAVGNTYILEMTQPFIQVIRYGQYQMTDYVPVERILVE